MQLIYKVIHSHAQCLKNKTEILHQAVESADLKTNVLSLASADLEASELSNHQAVRLVGSKLIIHRSIEHDILSRSLYWKPDLYSAMNSWLPLTCVHSEMQVSLYINRKSHNNHIDT